MDLGVFEVVEKHQCDDGNRSFFCDLSGFVEGDLSGGHSRNLDELGESKGAKFLAKAGESMNAAMAVTPVAIRRGMIKQVENVGKLDVQSKNRFCDYLIHDSPLRPSAALTRFDAHKGFWVRPVAVDSNYR